MISRRLHLFEFLDLDWLPGWIRQALLEYLNFGLYRLWQPYRGVETILANWARKAGGDAVLDLGSGGGGHVDWLLRTSEKTGVSLPTFVLSDLFPLPNLPSYIAIRARYGEDKVAFRESPVDACDPRERKIPLRSMFSIFHHLRPEQARRLLANACRTSDGIIIAEGVRRAPLAALLMAIQLPVFMFVMPFAASNFSVRRLVFSAVVPVIPLMMAFDGAVSMLRAYTASEIESLFPDDAREHFVIESARLPVLGGLFETTVVTAYRRS